MCVEMSYTCSGGEEQFHDGVAVVPGGVVHRRVALVVDVVDLRLTAVDVRLDHVQQAVTSRLHHQWRNKVAVGPRANILKGPPLPQKKLLKNSVGQILGPHSAGPACTARLARPIVSPLGLVLSR